MTETFRKSMLWPLCLVFLAGLCFGGPRYILCVGDHGHTEFETICLPSCSEATDGCGAQTTDDCRDEHDDCSNCSDLELDGPLWSKRPTRVAKPDLGTAMPVTALSLFMADFDSALSMSHLSHDHGPPLGSKAPTVLRC